MLLGEVDDIRVIASSSQIAFNNMRTLKSSSDDKRQGGARKPATLRAIATPRQSKVKNELGELASAIWIPPRPTIASGGSTADDGPQKE